jgi:hypothetical protein
MEFGMALTDEVQRRTALKRYVAVVFATGAAILASMLAVNLLVDPLWYLNGNVLTGMNFQYNERHSKAYRFLRDPDRYDCLIFGSSTGSLLNENKINGYDCFNFSFSHATAKEYVTYARFARRHLKQVRLVIVSADAYSLLDKEIADRSPGFVREEGREPPSMWRAYLSRTTLRFSIDTLRDIHKKGIYYRDDFTAAVHPDSPSYEPEDTLSDDFERRFGHKATDRFSERHIALYREIRGLFPEAQFVGVSPPIAAHYVGFLRLAHTLHDLLEAKYALSRVFDRYYDFSLPSPVTKDPSNTYDGEHFALPWNDHVIAIVNGRADDFGVPVHALSLASYRTLFLALIDDFIAEARIRLN